MTARHVFTVNLRDEPGAVEAYIRFHAEVWPEVTSSLVQAGVRRMDIYLLGRRVVMVVEMREGIDYRDAFVVHASSSPRVAEWERLMKSLQQPADEAKPGDWWAAMEPVFHLEHGRVASESSEQQEPAFAHVADRSRTS